MDIQSFKTLKFKILIGVSLALLCPPLNSRADDLTKDNQNKIHILPNGIGIPVGAVLLIKKNNEICALRFTSAILGQDKKEPTIWSSGEESKYAEYDWYCAEGVNPKFSESSTKQGHKKLSFKAPKGIGRLAFQTGSTRIKVGTFDLFWSYPTYVYFPENDDTKVSFAPTAYQQVDAIDLNQNLTWYANDNTRKREYISLK